MAYTSLNFWLFCGLVLAGTVCLRGSLRPLWLLAASLWFYAAPHPFQLVWLCGVSAIAVIAVQVRFKAVQRSGIVALVALLAWAKFSDALGLPDLHPPPGLSFIIFTGVALISEAMRRQETWKPVQAFLHLVWFPKLLAGPIERPQAVIPQFSAIAMRPGMAALGFSWLLIGLVKKLVIADNLAPVVDSAYDIPAYAPALDLLIASYFFAFQIYCDFSGYADIAVGLSLLVGLQMTRNFDRPYLATTVTEFWSSRWHISLSRWFRDFVYVPLGGGRAGRLRQLVNLMAVFLLSGLWHAGLGYGVGWGFVIWGALNGAIVCLETGLPSPRRPIPVLFRTLVTFHLILITWVFFRASNPSEAMTILRRISSVLTDLPSLLANYPFSSAQIAGAGLIGTLLFSEIASGPRSLAERLSEMALPLRWAGWYGALAILLLAGRWQETAFIYAGF